MKKKLNIYISYSLNNTSKDLLYKLIKTLINKGYNVNYHVDGLPYDKTKLEKSDLVLFIGKHFSSENTAYHEVNKEYLSKGQYEELIYAENNFIPMLFLQNTIEDNDVLVNYLFNPPIINSPHDWKGKYSLVQTINGMDNYSPTIEYAIDQIFDNSPTTTVTYNLLLLV